MDKSIELIRCKDCEFCDIWTYADKPKYYFCARWEESHLVDPDGFCNEAERRKEVEEDASKEN